MATNLVLTNLTEVVFPIVSEIPKHMKLLWTPAHIPTLEWHTKLWDTVWIDLLSFKYNKHKIILCVIGSSNILLFSNLFIILPNISALSGWFKSFSKEYCHANRWQMQSLFPFKSLFSHPLCIKSRMINSVNIMY